VATSGAPGADEQERCESAAKAFGQTTIVAVVQT
jgi:hypothetical protein